MELRKHFTPYYIYVCFYEWVLGFIYRRILLSEFLSSTL